MKILLMSFLMATFFGPAAIQPADISVPTPELAVETCNMIDLDSRDPSYDLVIGAINIDLGECQVEGSTFTWSVDFCNNGYWAAPPCAMEVRVFAETSSHTYYAFSMPSIPAQGCLTYSGTGTHINGHVSIRAVADIYDIVPETDEFNNVGSDTEYCEF